MWEMNFIKWDSKVEPQALAVTARGWVQEDSNNNNNKNVMEDEQEDSDAKKQTNYGAGVQSRQTELLLLNPN